MHGSDKRDEVCGTQEAEKFYLLVFHEGSRKGMAHKNGAVFSRLEHSHLTSHE